MHCKDVFGSLSGCEAAAKGIGVENGISNFDHLNRTRGTARNRRSAHVLWWEVALRSYDDAPDACRACRGTSKVRQRRLCRVTTALSELSLPIVTDGPFTSFRLLRLPGIRNRRALSATCLQDRDREKGWIKIATAYRLTSRKSVKLFVVIYIDTFTYIGTTQTVWGSGTAYRQGIVGQSVMRKAADQDRHDRSDIDKGAHPGHLISVGETTANLTIVHLQRRLSIYRRAAHSNGRVGPSWS